MKFVCSKCDQEQFPVLQDLLYHLKSVHAPPLAALEEEISSLTCTLCCQKFLDVASLTGHRATHLIDYECVVCSQKFDHRSLFESHLRTEKHRFAIKCRRVDDGGQINFVCDLCNDKQPSFPELVQHRKIGHPRRKGEMITCQPCAAVFRGRKNFVAHLRSKKHARNVADNALKGPDEKMEFECDKCDKKFVTRSSFQTHKRIFTCEKCEHRCCSVKGLQAHRKSHGEPKGLLRFIPLDEKPYSCTQCDKRFSRNLYRKLHISSTHQGHRFKCDVCLKEFKLARTLKCHKKKCPKEGSKNLQASDSNSKRKKFWFCDVCEKPVTTRGQILKHVEVVHFQDKTSCPYGCTETQFKTDDEWIHHLEECTSDKITDNSVSCYFCGATFRSQLLRISHHLKVHKTHDCDLCAHKSTTQEALHKHKLSHPEWYPHHCIKCDKKFRSPFHFKHHRTTVCCNDEKTTL
ncbi:zinc finger protein 26-like isoform X1 [Folsomia candida]|uniref:zinc finger protein 26-like isoform X1 n=2 Tax=Folsomia candida TaxID=158441 RepID=UPI0016050D2B|nr:zinc finger protein 26-like isoform X1 [Folsomia candida]XP_035715875.1 zinc finger protein 26-like isoform X1 [Folsomia candida]XP_035715876.1 zinc finger protein 26-like isoform X1 [Folsomia candida]XP_035715877.1 zinc finger protein 26-like isoform X1 [Folsomia candida]XP_035715878.1 zinc finger protein 26-like isoform X1 [Folsomia candida]